MLRRLAFGGVRVSQLTAPMTVEGETFPAGTWVIPTDQEFIALAREVLDPQIYPDLREFDGGPPEQPYDAAGWTLPMTMGVRVVTATQADDGRGSREDEDARGRCAARDQADAVQRGEDGRGAVRQRARRRIRHASDGGGDRSARRRDHRHRRAPRDRSGGDQCVPRAQRGVEGERHGEPRRRPLCDQRPERCGARRARDVARDPRRARRGRGHGDQASRASRLFEPPNSMDAGWTKWVLERYGFEFTSVNTADITPATSAIAST